MAFVYISQLILKLRASAQWAAVRDKLEELWCALAAAVQL